MLMAICSVPDPEIHTQSPFYESDLEAAMGREAVEAMADLHEFSSRF